MNRKHYLKHRQYFLTYRAHHSPSRRFPYCLVCGQPNGVKKSKQRLIKTCSLACSLTWNRIYQQNYQATNSATT